MLCAISAKLAKLVLGLEANGMKLVEEFSCVQPKSQTKLIETYGFHPDLKFFLRGGGDERWFREGMFELCMVNGSPGLLEMAEALFLAVDSVAACGLAERRAWSQIPQRGDPCHREAVWKPRQRDAWGRSERLQKAPASGPRLGSRFKFRTVFGYFSGDGAGSLKTREKTPKHPKTLILNSAGSGTSQRP